MVKNYKENIDFVIHTDTWRISLEKSENGEQYICYDVHGLSKAKAKKNIKNIIAVIPDEFVLNIIHGYNHGTKIKEMLYCNQLSERITKRESLVYNPGSTFLSINNRCA